MRARLGIALLLIASSTALVSPQQQRLGPFGPFRIGPGRHVGEIRWAPDGSGLDYSLFGDHCEISQDKFLCLFVFDAHQGNPKEWPAKKAWMENYAVDETGEKHSKISAFFLTTRGVQQQSGTFAAGDKMFFVQVFENGDRTITRLNIISPFGEIRNLPVE
jgi:hypothetical protein